MFIETERTPNPATLKFLVGRTVMAEGTAEFADAETAEASSPLAAALFMADDVTRVLFGSDFVAVTLGGKADWTAMKPLVLGVLVDHFSSAAPLFHNAGGPTAVAHDDDPEDAEIVAQIIDLIDTRVRPQVANDGGDIIYRGFRDGIVSLQMQGACSGCPSSTATLKNGIESLLKYYVPEVTEVRAVQ